MRKTTMLFACLLAIAFSSSATTSHPVNQTRSSAEALTKLILSQVNIPNGMTDYHIRFHEGLPANIPQEQLQWVRSATEPEICVAIVTTTYNYYDDEGNYTGSVIFIDTYVFYCDEVVVIEIPDRP